MAQPNKPVASRIGLYSLVGGASILLMGLAGLGATLGYSALTGDEDEPTQATSVESPSPTDSILPSETSTAPQGTDSPTDSVELSVGEAIDLPAGITLLVQTGCYGCDLTPGSIVRVSTGSNGTVTETVFDLQGLERTGVGQDLFVPEEGLANFAFVAAQGDDVGLAVCVHGFCLGGPRGQATDDSMMAIHYSHDAGRTWTLAQEIPGGTQLATMHQGSFVSWVDQEVYAPVYSFVDTPEPIDSPIWGDISTLDDGQFAWSGLREPGVVVSQDGTILASIRGLPGTSDFIQQVTGTTDRGVIAAWGKLGYAGYEFGRFPPKGSSENPTPAWQLFNGRLRGELVTLPGNDNLLFSSADLQDLMPERDVGDFVPVLIDIEAATMYPLSPFLDEDFPDFGSGALVLKAYAE